MSFYALVDIRTGETTRVVRWFEEPLPDGIVAIELPAPWDDVSRMEGWKPLRGAGGGNGEAYAERDESKAAERAKHGTASMLNAEQFFIRLSQEVERAEQGRRTLSLLLFDLAQADRATAAEFVKEMLEARGQELLPCDTLARVRPYLVAVILPDVDASGTPIVPHRGSVTTLTYPADKDAIDAVRKRQHPLIRKSQQRSGAAPAA